MNKINITNDIILEIDNITKNVYAPLKGFLKQDDLNSVLEKMKLIDGSIWSIPIIFDINSRTAKDLKNGEDLMLLDENNSKIAILKNIEIYRLDKNKFSQKIFGTTDIEHPGVSNIMNKEDFLIGGEIKNIQIENCNKWLKFKNYYFDPDETKEIFKKKGWKTIVAFQTRNIPHRSHEFLQKIALAEVDGLMVQPVIGKKKTGDFKDEVIIEAYRILFDNCYNKDKTFLNILPLRMNYAGPREAVHHALIRKNYGCTHMIIGRDHAGVSDYYDSYDAHKIFDNFNEKELGIKILKYENVSHCHGCGKLKEDNACHHDCTQKFHISGTKIREMIKEGSDLPEELIRKNISEYLLKHKNPFV
ncbi:sulfate adenylyltransferase [Candidatus Parcubacteria bacterium]|nr:sulfate adenylyltransferase [Candidatus Parcubacteria bacterium]